MKSKDSTPSLVKPFSTCGTALAFCLFLAPSLSHGDAVFVFPDALVNQGIDDGTNGRLTVTDLGVATPVTLSTVEIVGQDGSLASTGTLNVMGSGNNAMGVNSVNNVNGNSNNDRDFDPGEQWVFKFDVDVELVEINFAGWTDGESEVTLSFSDDTSDIVLNAIVEREEYDLSNTLIAAGVEITLEVTNVVGDNQVRLQDLTVAAVAGPPTGDNLVWAGSDGGAWNTVDANFTGDDTIFATGDNVEIQTAGAINVDAFGITAGLLTDTTPTGTVTLQTGDLTGTSLTKSGASTLLIDSIALDATIVTTLSGGTLQVGNGATLTTTSVDFSGGSTLQIDSGAAFTAGAAGLLGQGGVIIDTEEAISLGGMLNDSLETDPVVPLTKQGTGVLTLTGDLGVQNSGAVDLDILGGSIVAQGDNQLNIRGTNVWNGDVTLSDADLEFHGSSVSGTGSIIAQSGSASINGRFNRGNTNIANGILLNSALLVDAPTNGDNGSELYLNGVISGAGTLEKGGNGRVVLTETNTYTSTTTVNAGILQVGGGLESTSGSLGTGAVSLAAGGIEFSRNDAHVVANAISGAGNVIINNGANGSTALTATNSYTGITSIDGGTLIASDIGDGGVSSSIGASTDDAANLVLRGQGILSYTGSGALTLRSFSLGGVSNDGVTGGGTISADGSGPLEFDDDTADVGADGTGTADRVLTLSGTAPGVSLIALRITDGQASTHSVVKDGTNTWLLTGINTYSGDTVVNNGTLQLGASTDLTDASVVRINGATSTLQLTDGVTDVVKGLWIDGVQMDAGLYGSSTSSAPLENQDDTRFSGTGTLSVTSGPGFEGWATANGIDGELPGGDFDFDGISNLLEYALGTNPAASTEAAGVYSGDTVTFTKGSDAITNGDVSWTIETSSLLTPGSWTPQVVQPAGDATATIEYTFTPGSPDKEFARLSVTQN
ncbi:MAG: beta strand repeat-containing protein [Opitutaceae bacterium]